MIKFKVENSASTQKICDFSSRKQRTARGYQKEALPRGAPSFFSGRNGGVTWFYLLFVIPAADFSAHSIMIKKNNVFGAPTEIKVLFYYHNQNSINNIDKHANG